MAMSKTYYNKKFRKTGLSFKQTNLSNQEGENFTDLRNSQSINTKKESWKIFINLKKLKNPFKNKTPTSNKNNFNYIPPLNKMAIIQKNKAPSLKENQKEILNFIKKRKIKQNKEINNLFNSILVNESKLFRNNLYITQSENKLLKSNSILNIKMNKTDKVFHPNKNKFKNKNKNNTLRNISKNNDITGSTSVDYHNINSDTKYSFPFLNKENSILNQNKKNNTFYKSMYKSMNNFIKCKSYDDFSRIRMEINDAIFNKVKSINDFCLIGKKMMKFKVINNIQNDKLKKASAQEDYDYDGRISKLIKLKDIIDDSYRNYSEKMNDYLDYLLTKIREHRKELNILDKQIKEIDDDLEVIILRIVDNQTKLEYLVERRNFLLLIKQRFGNPPSYYEELLIRDSKKILVGDAICDLKVIKLIKSKKVMIFNNSYLEIKEKINKNLLNINNIIKYSVGPIIENQLFGSVDEFIQLYKNLENNNLKYLDDEAFAEKQIYRLKQQYEQESSLVNNIEDEEIIKKEKELEKLVNKNEILERTYNHYREIIIKSMDIKNNNSINSNDKKISSLDLNSLKKYRLQLQKNKYDGLLLLRKLIELMKNLSHIKYDKSQFLSEIFNDKQIKSILNLNLHKYNKAKLMLINSYIILLISKYEIICKYIINKNDIYSLNEKNKAFIKEKKLELTIIKKKENSEELRQIIKEKKIEDINKLINESNKISPYIPNKVSPEDTVKRSKALKIFNRKILADSKNNYLENEFNELVKYKDDF